VARERLELRAAAVGADEGAEDAQDRREAELLGEGRAAALVEPPVLDRIGRARVETPRAWLADAELLGIRKRGEPIRGMADGRVRWIGEDGYRPPARRAGTTA
jgi:hypothetical protein